MELDYYIHGHPTAFDYIGNPSEKDYFLRNFFNNIFSTQHANGTKGYNELRLELYIQNSKPFFLYTYFIGNNLIGKDGRPSYFAISIKSDLYYKRVRSLYFIIDSFVHSYLYKELFDNSKFKLDSFSSIKEKLKQDIKKLESLIYETSEEEDFIPLQVNSLNNNLEKINLSDASDNIVKEKFESYGRVSISESHSSKQVQEELSKKQNEIQLIHTQYENKIRQIKLIHQTQIDEKNREISNINKQQNNKKSEINTLRKNLQKEQEKNKEYDEKISQLKNILNSFTTSPNGDGHSPRPPRPGRGRHPNKIWTWFKYLLGIILLVVFVFVCIKFCRSEKESEDRSSSYMVPSPRHDEVGTIKISYADNFKPEHLKVDDTIYVQITHTDEGYYKDKNDNDSILEILAEENGKTPIILKKPGNANLGYYNSQGQCITNDDFNINIEY